MKTQVRYVAECKVEVGVISPNQMLEARSYRKIVIYPKEVKAIPKVILWL